MSELKPCPFCGKEQSEKNFFSCDGYPQACGCWELTHSGEEAINVWNTRPIEDGLRAELARLNVIAIDAVTLNDELIGKVKRLNEYIKALENEPIRSKSVIKRLRAQTIEREG